MKRFLIAMALCSMFLAGAAFVLTPRSVAQSDLVISLLAFPAPPPKGTVFEPPPPKRPEEFYSKSNIPADDAPIEELMEYWSHHGLRSWEAGYFPRPSKTVLSRLKGEIERRPKELTSFLRLLPTGKESAKWVKGLYDDEMNAKALDPEWRSITRDWLVKNSSYFSDELSKLAGEIKDDENGYISGQTELIALARNDWEKAKPMVDRLLYNSSQPNSQVVAKWALYVNAIESGSEGDTEKYRSELQRIVEDRNALPAQRDLALDALVKEKEWPGRDDWYFSLFSDETLLNLKTQTQTLTGLTTIVTESGPEKYKARLLAMIASGDPNIRSAAVQALSRLAEDDIEVATAMLPWLDDPRWAKDSNDARATFVKSLASHKIPESVPGLISLLDEALPGRVKKFTDTPNADTNTRQPQTKMTEGEEPETFPYRPLAVSALQRQADGRAVPALRRILFNVTDKYPYALVSALFACKGFTPSEEAEALELYSSEAVTQEANVNQNLSTDTGDKDVPAREAALSLLGTTLANASTVSDATAIEIAARIDAVETRRSAVADRMRAQLAKWKGAGVNIALLQFLKRGKSDAEGVVRLLIDRKNVRNNLSAFVSDARSGNPYADGTAACIMEETGAYEGILEAKNPQTRAALYACARLIRAELPFEKATADMNSKDGILSLAAEKYVETIDTPEARALVLAKHKGEAKILGPFYFFEGIGSNDPQKANLAAELVETVEPSLDITAESFDSSNFYMTLDSFENEAKKIVQVDTSLVRLYAFKNYTLRQYPDKVLLSVDDITGARFWERELRPGEFKSFENLLATQRMDDVKPVLSAVYSFAEPSTGKPAVDGAELLILSKDGGRRLFSKSANPPRLLQETERLFSVMSSEQGRLRYHFELEVPGTETVYIGSDLRAATFWKNGADMRVLVNNIPEQKRIASELDTKEEEDSVKPDFNPDTGYQEFWNQRRRRNWESFSWYYLAGQSFGAPAPQPDGIDFIPARDSEGFLPENDGWKARGPGFEIRADESGIYKVAGGQSIKIRSGSYSLPVISADGRYVIAQRLSPGNDGATGDVIVKINVVTKSERTIAMTSEQERREPVAFLPAVGKFLIFAGYYDEHEGNPEGAVEAIADDLSVLIYEDADFFLFDPVTNSVTEASKGLAPFAHQTFRPLQATGRPNEFWAAMPSFDYDTSAKSTRIGVVNARTGRFRELVVLNKIFFDSMAMWVDDKLYFAYQGHVVSIPKPKLPALP